MEASHNKIFDILSQVDKVDSQRFLLSVCEPLLKTLQADHCIFFMLDESTDELYAYATIGSGGIASQNEIRVKRGRGIAGWVALHLKPLLIEDTAKDSRYAEEVGKSKTPLTGTRKGLSGHRSIIAVPLMVFGSLQGVFEIINSGPRRLLWRNLEFIQPLVNMIALTIHREDTDATTKLAEICIRFLEERDRYTHGHSLRVTAYSMIIADELNLPESQKRELRLCALLHDIGKITLKDSILGKDERLTKLEMQTIRMHSVIGSNIASGINKPLARKILSHHENYNGTGYPEGLKGEQIPLISRIIGLADSFDAMTTDRAYRSAKEIDFVIKEIAEGAGTQFDPQVVEAFLKACREGKINIIKV